MLRAALSPAWCSTAHAVGSARLRLDSLGNKPQLFKPRAGEPNLNVCVSVLLLSDPSRCLGRAGAEGLRGNEAQ